jgi:hypothetical protein
MQIRTHGAVVLRPDPARRPAVAFAWLAAAALLAALAAPAAMATTVTGIYSVGSTVEGTLSITTSNSVQIFGGPFQDPVGDRHWSVLAGMTTTAAATPIGAGSNLAWLQTVTVHTGGAVFGDAHGNPLTAPWPDTPPGGYTVTSIFGQPIAPPGNQQVFDSAPWYGNSTVGQTTYSDQPKEGLTTATGTAKCDFEFETWLVYVTDATAPDYSVIPLIGFTWGYTYRYGSDVNTDGILGDQTNEYMGTVLPIVLERGGQPSAAFENAYAGYFDITYLANNDANAALTIPEPMTAATVLLAVGGLAGYVRRRSARWSLRGGSPTCRASLLR